MSASLVGSEMCIRDSGAPRARAILAVGRFQLSQARLAPTGRPSAERPGRCLLYTSDAADDM
eukprot:1839650-Alexandrium_andersonii.AAC.1